MLNIEKNIEPITDINEELNDNSIKDNESRDRKLI